ncbi:PREDICTED: uncharacterized protein LOC105368313 [Ceratosolen solmsi marchali]|uniref:Uncharacterized protein LOC105368313 n=1 Tax=Ceratosolen solmsi marchali TaxID=326594 RepID=A0AAJ6YWC1_9HYME|nr:PREDICTED: uncharacterized protein LOC105368313 [Ceratosolen solmsi marchali]
MGKSVQYHSQDSMSGSYQYGYTGPHHAKSESNVDGITRGGYSYIDANGLMQSVSYTADAENGFRVQASNLPRSRTLIPAQDTPEVALAKNRHLAMFQRQSDDRQTSDSSQLEQPQYRGQQHYQYQSEDQQQLGGDLSSNTKTGKSHLLSNEETRGVPMIRSTGTFVLQSPGSGAILLPGYASHQHHNYVMPGVYTAVPLSLLHTSASHSQDSLGQYQYSYTGDTSAKTESRSLDGTTRGAYSYIDANGLLQQVHYIADRDGFRVLATNIPEA